MPPSEMLSSFFGGKEAEGISAEGIPSAVLAAFSGGADSSLLLYLLRDWCAEKGVKLYAAHVNHGIRDGEAFRDRDFCLRICEKAGIEAFVLDADVPRIAVESGKSIESAARDVRYDFFAKIMAENNIPVLATAHNADDNLETLIFRLARGTALRGLCGIPPVRKISSGGFVVRPILALTKDEILDACRDFGIEYVYDSTNSDTVYARNSIRASVLPILRSINPEASKASVRTSEFLRADCDYLDCAAEKYLAEKDSDSTSKLSALEEPIFNRAMVMLYMRHSDAMLEYTHIEALRELVKKAREHSSISLPGRKRAFIEKGRLSFAEDNREPNDPVIPDEILISEGDNHFGEYVLRLEDGFSTFPSHSTPQIQRTEENIYKLFTQVIIQSDKINGSLRVRCRRSGDKIRSAGMSKDIRKLFSAHRIPLSERAGYPIICDDDGILWIPNVALRDGVKANKNNENSPLALKITFMGGLH
ncbi:MAG: tRNA lysidine(34) synthetase TilS [Clostridia bacterium]|nr:tRNA lysidine(34) synthetase TilS [Clostridia bacterium]